MIDNKNIENVPDWAYGIAILLFASTYNWMKGKHLTFREFFISILSSFIAVWIAYFSCKHYGIDFYLTILLQTLAALQGEKFLLFSQKMFRFFLDKFAKEKFDKYIDERIKKINQSSFDEEDK